ANGIDGIVSTAMGIAMESRQTFLVTGDLAFLHDQNGLLNGRALRGGLTVILIHNGGGGIFESLPAAKFDPPFREFFATPQAVDFERICAAHGIGYETAGNWERFAELVEQPWTAGIRVVELRT